MAKLKSSFSRKNSLKQPSLGGSGTWAGGLPKGTVPKETSGQSLKVTNAGTVAQALTFGALHTKVTGSGSNSQWSNLLSVATAGGASSLFSSGILSNGTFGFVSKLLSLFGGSKSTPAAPTPFVMPVSQQQSINVGSSNLSSAVSLGVQSSSNLATQSGPIYRNESIGSEQSTYSAQVVQIVKQALLTSSSLNDVISEI